MHSKFMPFPAIPLASAGGSRHKSSSSRLMSRCSKGPHLQKQGKTRHVKNQERHKRKDIAYSQTFQATSEGKVHWNEDREALDLEHLRRRHDPVVLKRKDLAIPDQRRYQLRAGGALCCLRCVHEESRVSRIPRQASMFPALPETTYQERFQNCLRRWPEKSLFWLKDRPLRPPIIAISQAAAPSRALSDDKPLSSTAWLASKSRSPALPACGNASPISSCRPARSPQEH